MRIRLHSLVFGLLSAALILANPSQAGAAGLAVVELKTGTTAYQGKIVARNKHLCWLLDRDGQLNAVELKSVTAFREVSPRFRPLSFSDLRDKLLREFGRGYEVATTRHYLVCATGGKAAKYAELFEHIYRTFHLHFAVRGFTINEPEFPLIAIVFPERESFAAYCRRDGVNATQGLAGYYLRTSNRVALFDPGTEALSSRAKPLRLPAGVIGMGLPEPNQPRADLLRFAKGFGGPGGGSHANVFARVEGSLRDTIIHEATHQVAFNTGLHGRVGENPQWIVEGLATVFEAPGVRDTSTGSSPESRLNRERFLWFRNFAKKRRESKSLAKFISGDNLFQSATLDAYSQAWALTFYLIETRPREYAGYLKSIASRDPVYRYTEKERLEDFQKAFGQNIDLLEANFLRHLERMR